MPEQPGHIRPARLSRFTGHAVVVGGIAAIAISSSIGIGFSPDVQLVTAARANNSDPSVAVVAPGLISSAGDPSLENRSTISERSEAGLGRRVLVPAPVVDDPAASPLPTPVPVDPNATPLAAPPKGPITWSGGQLAFPVPGGAVSQSFRAGHQAVDIAAAPGSPILAADRGLVTWAGWRNNGGGLVIEIDHGNGVSTAYNHLGSIWVTAGQYVGRGSQIAGMGCTGVCFGPHVQFDVRINGRLIDPSSIL